MDDPNSVEVDEQMPERPFPIIHLEECAIPVDMVETHITLCWWNIDKASLTKGDQHIDPCHKRLTYLDCEHSASDALWIPEQLVHIIVTDDAIIITFSLHKLSINGLIALIKNEAVKGLDNCVKVEAFCGRGRNACSMSRPKNRSAGRAPPSGTSVRPAGGTC